MSPSVLEAAFQHIDAARRGGKACLVHCKAGTSRSCSLVLGYLMQLGEGMSLLAALEFCQGKRRQVRGAVILLISSGGGWLEKLSQPYALSGAVTVRFAC